MPAQIKISPEAGAEHSKGPLANISRQWYFSFFFVSGFCSILYELIWLRLAMAQFGVTTAMVSIVLSSFMAGLGLGSWAAGHFVRKYARRLQSPPLQFYAITELLIGCSAVVVPGAFVLGRSVLEHLGNGLALSSSGYYVVAGVWIACSLIPWCACMGACLPSVAKRASSRDARSVFFISRMCWGRWQGRSFPCY
jgi:spermidine synthase